MAAFRTSRPIPNWPEVGLVRVLLLRGWLSTQGHSERRPSGKRGEWGFAEGRAIPADPAVPQLLTGHLPPDLVHPRGPDGPVKTPCLEAGHHTANPALPPRQEAHRPASRPTAWPAPQPPGPQGVPGCSREPRASGETDPGRSPAAPTRLPQPGLHGALWPPPHLHGAVRSVQAVLGACSPSAP